VEEGAKFKGKVKVIDIKEIGNGFVKATCPAGN
jgi:hypothetical protein